MVPENRLRPTRYIDALPELALSRAQALERAQAVGADRASGAGSVADS